MRKRANASAQTTPRLLFDVVKIMVPKFMYNEERAIENKDNLKNTPFNIKLNTIVTPEKKIFEFSLIYQFFAGEKREVELLELQVDMAFLIHNFEKIVNFDEVNKTIVVPDELFYYLGNMIISTARGILYERTKGTLFNQFILPIIDMSTLKFDIKQH